MLRRSLSLDEIVGLSEEDFDRISTAAEAAAREEQARAPRQRHREAALRLASGDGQTTERRRGEGEA